MTQAVCDMVAVYAFRYREHGPELLLLRRSPGREMAGSWQPVYGHMEPGETAVRTAWRELLEEAGLRPIRFYQLSSVDTFYIASQDTIHHCTYFAAEIEPDAVVQLDHEHDAFDWHGIERVAERLMWPGQRRMLHELREEILAAGPALLALAIPFDERGPR